LSNNIFRKLCFNPNRGTENLVKITVGWDKDTELSKKNRKWRLVHKNKLAHSYHQTLDSIIDSPGKIPKDPGGPQPDESG
jgi:hypothetical protein